MEQQSQPRAPYRQYFGEDAPALKPPSGGLTLLVERVAVPAMWFGLGYVMATMLQKKGS